MSALKDSKENVAIDMKAKEALICKLAFPKPSKSFELKLVVFSRIAYKRVTKVEIANAFMF